MTVTTRDNYISLYSPYGSDGIVILKKEYNPKKYTKMIIKGKRIDGDSSYYHFFPGYTTTLSSWGSNLKTFFPSYGESFEYTVDLNFRKKLERQKSFFFLLKKCYNNNRRIKWKEKI